MSPVSGRGRGVTFVAAGVALLTVVIQAADGRTVLKPGWNLYSPEQDIEVGQQVSEDAERQLSMLDNARVDRYVNTLGRRLAAKVPGQAYPFQFTVVNDHAINAFALPGGPVYINRGVIEAASNESQLAGVIAHEAAHVALRHGTNQASRAAAAQVPLAILGGLIGSDSIKGMLAQLGAGFAMNSVLLKNSRTAETQADVMGTQILFDAGHDPRAMAQFFELIEDRQEGGGPVEFFSNHPSPENRIERVDQEVLALGGVPRNASTNSREFDDIKRYLASLPAPSGERRQTTVAPGDRRAPTTPDQPSERFVTLDGSQIRISHPDNWRTSERGDAMTITPSGGLIDDREGNQALAYGVIVNLFEPRQDGVGQQLQGVGWGAGPAPGSEAQLSQATDELVQTLRLSNQNMRVTGSGEAIRVDGEPARSTYLSNDSPAGGRETDWLVTLAHPDGLLFLVFAAPEREFERYESVFRQMLRSVQVRR